MKDPRSVILAIIVTIAAVGQIILAILLYNPEGNTTIINLGWVILWISAIFGCLPIFTLKKWGKVAKGQSYIQTQQVVDKGVYAIVRHPQYLAGILIGVGLSLISQHWAVAVLGVVAIAAYYQSILDEEKSNVEKFGEAYDEYKRRVPRLNFVLGIFRLFTKN